MKLRFTLFAILTLFMYNCNNSLKIYSTKDKEADFASYKTFNFYEISEKHLNLKEVNRRRLAMAIELELGMKGVKRSINDPDLLVNVYSLINREENINADQSTVGYYGAATPYGVGIGVSVSPGNNSQYFTKGTVTIDLVDRKQNKLVLEGVAKIDAGDGEDADRMINYTVKKIFAEYPDPGKKK